MKQIYIFSLLLVLLSSCRYEERDIFDLSPAERLNKALTDNYNTLAGAVNGWEMTYFANPGSAGYMLLVKFRTDGMAVIASQSELTPNQLYEQDSCLFEMIADYGPVLTFNTFNKVLHRFSNPENPDGFGLEGDYEFIVLKNDGDKMIVQGKKHKSIIVLTKLPDNTNWVSHLQSIANTGKLLFAANSPKLSMTVKGSVYSFTEGYKHIFVMRKEGVTATTPIPFIVTNQGLRFQSAVEIEGVSFQDFKLNADSSALVSVENPDSKLTGAGDLATYAMNSIKVWNLNPQKMSTGLKTAFGTVSDGFKSTYNADSISLGVTYFINRFILTVVYQQGTTKTEGKIDMDINATGKDALSISKKTTADANGSQFMTNIPALGNFITLLSNNYALSTKTRLNPQEIKLTKKTDSNQWFVISEK